MFKRVVFVLMILSIATGISQTVYAAMDCSGGWNVLPNYKGGGGPCKVLGLNSRVGTCQSGHAYETLCDDTKGGRYRTCQGPRKCNVAPPQYKTPPVKQTPCTTWDYVYNQPCPRGYVNKDCRGGCEPY